MAMTPDSRPSATTLDVESLVNMAWNGKIRVPTFQRDFRWAWEDVRRLFDSIVRGYPIGSLLLWVRPAPEQKLQLGALSIDAPKSTDAFYVVDGQQRITSLANALSPDSAGDPRFALSYDLREERFVRPPKNDDPLVIPLPVLFDLQKILLWFNRNPGIADHLESASAITRTIRQFQVPAYQVSQDDPKVLQDIFDRMNNYGKRLTRAEIFSALNAREDNSQFTLDLVAEHIATDLSFGTIDGNTVLQSVLARRGTDVKRDVRDEFSNPGDEGQDRAYEAGEAALRRAVTFLQQDCSVPHFSVLAYSYLLVPLVRLFAHHPDPDPRNRRLLRRWFWRAAVAGPQQFKAGTGDAARLLCTRVSPYDLTGSVQALLETVEQPNPKLPDLSGFATNQASTKIVLCSWWAAGPRSPETGEPYSLQDFTAGVGENKTARDAVQYVVPSAPKPFRSWAANRVLMPILEVDPKEVLALLIACSDEEILRSHGLADEIVALFRSGKIPNALELRQDLLRLNLAAFLERNCEWGLEDTPPLADLVLVDDDDI